jgi:cell division protein FtsW
MAYKVSSDRMLFSVTSVLTIFGLIMVYSASSAVAALKHGSDSYFFVRQLLYAGVGFLSMILLMNVDYHFWQKEKFLKGMIALSIIGLLLVFTQPKLNGAQRWLRAGSLSFQPSELAKLVVLFFMAVYLQKHEQEIGPNWKKLVVPGLIILAFAGLIEREPDLGQAVCIAFIAAVLLFIAGMNWRVILSGVLLLIPAFYFFVVREPFRWKRFLAFFNPFLDPLGSGYHISQSLIAIGSGGLWGIGMGGSKQKLFFLPEAHSDFIFAVIGEELGLLGTALLLASFVFFFYRGMRITFKAPDRFGFYLGLGITLIIVLQAFINISMVLAMMPTKGMALPFISQGGSSLLFNLAATGILLNISHYTEST